MGDMTITIDEDELLGLTAVVAVQRAEHGAAADAESTARTLLRQGLMARLDELGLAWAPSPEATGQRVAAATAPDGSAAPAVLRRLARDARVRKYATTGLVVAVLVALWGGYIQGWRWTGFRANDQLWDWLRLLLLPVVVGTIPLWIEHKEEMSRTRRLVHAAVIVAFAGFVLAGYLVPLAWTGFAGNTLWDWFVLLLLPAALVSVRAWPTRGRPVRGYHKAAAGILAAGWVITLVGGYAGRWHWTGYPGNTLWDWLQLLLLPLVFPTILLPAALKWITGNAAQIAEDRRRAVIERLTAQREESPGGQEGPAGGHAMTSAASPEAVLPQDAFPGRRAAGLFPVRCLYRRR
jgi:hypothetical protein